MRRLLLALLLVASSAASEPLNLGLVRQAATDCTAETGGVTNEQCHELDDNTMYVCEAGPCDASGWVAYGAAGATDSISEGDSSVEVIDAGTGQVDIDLDGALSARFLAGMLTLTEAGGATISISHNGADGVVDVSTGSLSIADDVLMTTGKFIFTSGALFRPANSGIVLAAGAAGNQAKIAHNYNLSSEIAFGGSGATWVKVMGCMDFGSLATAPTPNGACDRYWDTDLNMECRYNGTNWVQADDWSTVCS